MASGHNGRRLAILRRLSRDEGRQLMILYGSSLSPYVRKVLAYAGEKGIELELQSTGFPNHSPEYLEASPFKKMPALRDGDFMLADSSAIIQYLEAKFPEPVLIPSDPKLRGKTIWFDEFSDTILTSCGAKMFFNRIVMPRFMGRPGDLAAADVAERDELPPILDYLERVVPDAGGFLVGHSVTLADIAVASPFANLAHLECEIDLARHGRVRAFVASILSRPSFAPWIERETVLLAKEPA
jgi:glutathione S-transferase